jgi:hypothetical protein
MNSKKEDYKFICKFILYPTLFVIGLNALNEGIYKIKQHYDFNSNTQLTQDAPKDSLEGICTKYQIKTED